MCVKPVLWYKRFSLMGVPSRLVCSCFVQNLGVVGDASWSSGLLMGLGKAYVGVGVSLALPHLTHAKYALYAAYGMCFQSNVTFSLSHVTMSTTN